MSAVIARTAMRATWLTWMLHRFEILVTTGLMAMLAASAWVVIAQLRGLDIPSGCWDQVNLGESERDVTDWCRDLVDRYHHVTGNAGGHVLLGLQLVPLAAGLVLGVPVVARELETRTTVLAWSLEGHRWRWLLARWLPMAALAASGLAVLAILAQELVPMMSPGYSFDALGNLGARGLPLLTRGVAALALALLAGALLGRTLPGLLLALVLALGLSTMDSTLVPNVIARGYAVWVPVAETQRGYVRSFAYRPTGHSAEPAEDVSVTGVDYELLVVPESAVPTLEGIQAAIDLAVIGLAVVGAFLVVQRRKPE